MATTVKKKKAKSGIAIQPIGDRIVVERESSEDVTSGGIVLPDSAKDKPSRGVVVSVGNGRLLKDGTRSQMQLKKGDRILFSSYAPEELNMDGQEFLLMREEDVLAVIEG